jgi:hypothetical protein
MAMVALVLVGLLFVPSLQFAQTSASSKISQGLIAQLDQTAPDQLVTVIVKMRDTADLKAVEGQRAQVFAALRSTASVSQQRLVDELKRPDMSGKVGVIRQFWIDNIVLVQATRDVVEQIAQRDDVKEVFDNFTVTLPPDPKSSEGPQGSSAATG